MSSVRGRRVLAQTAGTIGLNGATLAFNVAVALLLSRSLGPEGYGAFAFAVGWALLLAVPAMLGLSPLVVREIATYRVRQDWDGTRGLLRRAHQVVLVSSLALAFGAAIAFCAIAWPAPALFRPTLVGLGLVPLLALIAIRQSAMQGFGVVVLARVPEALVAPVLMIALIVALDSRFAGGISASSAAATQVAASAVAVLFGTWLLRRTIPDEVRRATPRNETRAWVVGSLPILLASGIQAVNVQAGTILTGSIAGSAEAGIYSAAARVSVLLPFLLLAVVPPLMPAIAELQERAEARALQHLLTRSARLVFFGSLPVAIAAIVFAGPILGLFGAGFGAGADTLRILSLGQLAHVGMGLAGTILLMVDEAGQATLAVIGGTALNLILSVALVPELGAEGAAIGTAAGMAVTNVLMAYLLWRRRRIYSPALRLWRSRSPLG